MKSLRSLSREQLVFGVLFTLLVALGALLFMHDLRHRPPGKSRIAWPEPAPAKP